MPFAIVLERTRVYLARAGFLVPTFAVVLAIVILSAIGIVSRNQEAVESKAINQAIDDIGKHRMLSMTIRALSLELASTGSRDALRRMREASASLVQANENARTHVSAAQSLNSTAVPKNLDQLTLLIRELTASSASMTRAYEGTNSSPLFVPENALVRRISQTVEAIVSSASAINEAIATEHQPAAEAADHTYQNVLAILVIALASGYTIAVTVPLWRRMHKETQRFRQMSEELWKLTAVAHRTTNIVIVTDVEGRIEWVNDAFTKITGYSHDEVVGQRPGTFLQFEQTDPVAVARISAALKARKAVQVELQNRAKDGRDYWVAIDIQPVTSVEGAHVGFMAIESDITDLKQVTSEVMSRNADLEIMSALANIGEWAVDAETGEVLWSAGVRSIHEVDDDFTPDLDAALGFYPDDAQSELVQALEECLENGTPWQGELRLVTARGNERWVRIYATSISEQDKVIKLVGAIQDITEMVQARDEIALSSRRLELAVEGASIGLWDWDVVQDRVWIHPKWWDHMGYRSAPEPFPLSLLSKGIHPDDMQLVERNIQTFLHGDEPRIITEFRHRDAAGQWRWVSSMGRATATDQNGRVLRASGVHVDIHERKVAAERAVYAAAHDSMTGLHNRAEFVKAVEKQIKTAAAQKAEFAIIAVDLDRFKNVNDGHGHLAGDALLIEIASRLKALVRDSDIVARFGGDEFAVLLTGGHDYKNRAAAVARRIVDAACQAISYDGRQVQVGASLGIAMFPDHGTTVEDLLQAADSALYAVKAEGKNNYRFFDRQLADRDQQRRTMDSELRSALERGEFELHFQAQCALASRKPLSAEALLRWKHPARGYIGPDQFIPVAEETGLIVRLGQWVIEEACRLAADWPEPLPFSVNLSAAQLGKTNLFDTVTAALLKAKIPASRLEIEVTESIFVRDDDALLGDLRRLHEIGVRLALDDFGTGYASLGYLQKLPFDRLKIDRSFVSGLPTNEKSAAIVRAVVNLGHSLGIQITAEGVETEDQVTFLRECGCEVGQGYLFAKPVPSTALFSVREKKSRNTLQQSLALVMPNRDVSTG